MRNLADVKVGDLLIKHYRGLRSVVKVEKLTPTQIVVTSGDRFRKKDGYEIGSGGFYHCYITIPKEGEVESIRLANFITNVCIQGKKMLDSYNISYEQALKIKEILNL